MKCIYCSQENKISLKSLFIEEDQLCSVCRNKLKVKRRIVKIEEMEVETFFEYEGIFKSLLIQYKECYDEALKDVFLYDLKDYLFLRYHGYKIAYVLSSSKKLKERGFNHLELMFESLNFRRVEGLSIKEDISQEGKNKKERKQIINNYLYKGEKLDKVLIVDDMLTTGSSLLVVYRTLLPYCMKIKVIALASKQN